jgi:ketosteroid isomerase-like protein
MTDSSLPTRLATAQEFLLHIGHPDFDRAIGLLSPQVVYRIPGRHALAGTFHGPDEVTAHLTTLLERTTGTFEALKWEDWLVGQDHVAALVTVHVQSNASAYTGRHLFLVTFDVDDRISGISVFFENEDSAERFFGQADEPQGTRRTPS